MKRTMIALLLGLSLLAGGCATTVAVRPARVWVAAHYEYVGFHRVVFVPGHWRY